MVLRLAVVVSHPIQHFAPWHREVARRGDLDLRVFFCCDWGVEAYADPEFGRTVKWDIPLTDGYDCEFMPIAKRPRELGFLQVDNPDVGERLSSFAPDVVNIFGYNYRTNLRAMNWARKQRRPILLYSDSMLRPDVPAWKRAAKEVVVRGIYSQIAGALFVGDHNRAYHSHFGIPDERLFEGVLPVDRGRLLGAVPDRAAARRRVRETHRVPDNAFVALSCGKLTARKRAQDLSDACILAASQKRPIWALLVGEGPERGAIEQRLRDAGATNVVLTGFVNQAEIPDYYAASDVLCVPSSRDPHPLVVTEAATFGLPIVASDALGNIGANDTVRDGYNAIVHPCGDASALAQALMRIEGDADLHQRMSDAAVVISEGQGLDVAAQQLAHATVELARLGRR
jgi:glycosyltransferase involved in cell wall biosynthesis